MSEDRSRDPHTTPRGGALRSAGLHVVLLVLSMVVAGLLVFGLEAVETVLPRVDEFAMFVLLATILFYLVVYRRLEEKARQAAASREAEERLEALFEEAGEIVTVYDASLDIVYRSPSFERLLGFDPSEYPGLALELVHPEDRSRAEAAVDRVAGGPPGVTVGPVSFRVRMASGEWRRFEGVLTNLEEHPAVRGFVLNWRDVTERREAEERASESYRRLRELNRRLQTIREEERIRLAREIHDELGQMLTGLRMDLQRLATSLRDDAEREIAERSIALADRMLEQVRRIARELRPAFLDTLGLEAAVEDLAEEFERRSGIDCRLRVRENGLDRIDDRIATVAYRVVQEALTNVARHADAERVEIVLGREGSDIELVVRDDGRGFDPDIAWEGLGILGMEERAVAAGGTLTIESERGEGTEVRLRVPTGRVREETS